MSGLKMAGTENEKCNFYFVISTLSIFACFK